MKENQKSRRWVQVFAGLLIAGLWLATPASSVMAQKNPEILSKSIKIQELLREKNYDAANEIALELFESDPEIFSLLIKLNKLKGTPEQIPGILQSALKKYQQLSTQDEILSDGKQWSKVHRGIAQTMILLKRFDDLETTLQKSIEETEEQGIGIARRSFLKRLLGQAYLTWGSEIIGGKSPGFMPLPENVSLKALDIYGKAYEIHDESRLKASLLLTEFGFSKNEQVAKKAKSIYDPEKDNSPSPAVLNHLGTQAMVGRQYDKAVTYYERARARGADNPVILNNLAYAYLVLDEPNPKRALQLCDQVLKMPNSQKQNTSNYLHTKATALKQLKRFKEAITSFELSLETRPDHPDTLNSVIECYQELDLDPPEKYLNRLKKN